MPAQDVLVIGLGYVGLPLAGRSHVDDVTADLTATITTADLVILLQAHRGYDLARIAATARLLLDTRGIVPDTPHVEAL